MGMVWQRGGNRNDRPPAWAWSRSPSSGDGPDVMAKRIGDVNALALDAAVRLSKAFLCSQHGGRPKNEATLSKVLLRRTVPKKLYVVHPVRLAAAMGETLPSEAVQHLEMRLQTPLSDPLCICENPLPEIPANVVNRVRRDFARRTAKGVKGQWEVWLTSQAFMPVDVDSSAVVKGLEEEGSLKIREDGSV